MPGHRRNHPAWQRCATTNSSCQSMPDVVPCNLNFLVCLQSVTKGPLAVRLKSGGRRVHEFLEQELDSGSHDLQVLSISNSHALAMGSGPALDGSHGRKNLTEFQDTGPPVTRPNGGRWRASAQHMPQEMTCSTSSQEWHWESLEAGGVEAYPDLRRRIAHTVK